VVDPAPESSELDSTEPDTPAVPAIVPLVDEVLGEGERPSLHVRLFGSHAFFRLWLSQAISSLGDWLGFLAITILAARVGGESSGAAVGLVMAARIVPGFFLSPVAGVLVDRLDRRKVMIVCDLGRAVVVAFLPFVENVLGLVIISLLLEIGTLFFGPAKEASVPNLVPPDRLASANSLSLAAAYGTVPLAAIIFAGLAKVSEAVGNIDALDFLKTDQETLAFVVRIATFLLSAAVIWSLHLPSPERRSNGKESGEGRIDWAATYHELREGWQFIFLNPIVRAVNLGLATGLIGGGMVVPLGSIFAEHVLHSGPAGFGIFVTALGVGVAVGVVLVSVTQKRLPRERTFTLAMFGAGGSLFAAACMSSLAIAFVFVFSLGMFAGAIYVVGFTLLHENVEDALRGRIFSALYTIVRLCLLIAFALGPFLSELLDRLSRHYFTNRTIGLPPGDLFIPGERLTLWFAAIIILIAGTIVAWSFRTGSSAGAKQAA
jgi:dTMP kinase